MTTRMLRSCRRIAIGTTMALFGAYLGVATTTGPAAADPPAATDGPPQIFYTTPQVARPAGGQAVRITGAGFDGTTSVTFGNNAGQSAAALDFKVVDSTLLTVTMPPQAAVGAVDGNCPGPWPQPDGTTGSATGIKGACTDIRITDNEGTGVGDPYNATGMLYTGGKLTISPQPVAVGKSFTSTIKGYAANASAALVEMNPLVGFIEGDASCATATPYCPAASGFGGPPPYIELLGFPPNTTAAGDLTVNKCFGSPCEPSSDYNHVPSAQPGVLSGPNDGERGYGYNYDHNISCPPTQESADYGLGQCMIGFGQFARGTLERHVNFGTKNPDGTVTSNQPVPAAPTLTLSSGAASPGDTVNVSGVHWNDNPWFGSDTTPNDPGETKLDITLCNSDGITNCVTVPAAAATVELTRYKTTSTTWSNPTYQCATDANGNPTYPCTETDPGSPLQTVFSGTALSGSFVVPAGTGCAPSCKVKVTQTGYNYDNFAGQASTHTISAASPLTLPVFPAVSVSDATVTEGDAGVTPASFTVSLSQPTTVPVTVSYATADVSATAPADYAANSGTVTFDPGETSKAVSVAVNGETTYETKEKFQVVLSSTINAGLADGTGVGKILNDDAMPTLSITDASALEGNSGTTPVTFTVTLSAPSGVTTTVGYTTADGTAKVATGDFATATGTVSFAPGETTKTLSVNVNGDTSVEADETFKVKLSTPVNATLADPTGVGRILNDD